MDFSLSDTFTYDQEPCDWTPWQDRNLSDHYATIGGSTIDEYGDQYSSNWQLADFVPGSLQGISEQIKSPDLNSVSEDIKGSVSYAGSPSAILPQPATWPLMLSCGSPPMDADLTSPPTSSHRQICRICNDTASGMHFGVMSCEACKSFFRRSIRAGARYVCRARNCCEVDKRTRNKCQHCRLQKCIDVGMKRNAVQEERTPYPTKEHKSLPRHSGGTNSSSTTSRNADMPFPFVSSTDMIKTNVKSQNGSVSVISEMLAKAEKTESNPGLPSPVIDGKVPENTKKLLLSVISWSKSIPIFTQLPVEDQIKLIKESWMEVNTLKLIYHITTGSGVAFNDLAQIENPAVASSIQKLTKECTVKMQDVCLDETELSCLKLIALMNPFIQNLTTSGHKEIEHTQNVGLELLEAHTTLFKSTSSQRMTKLLLFLSQVKALSKDISIFINDARIGGSKSNNALLKLILQNI